jgi:PAS domain S-box-containing protein
MPITTTFATSPDPWAGTLVQHARDIITVVTPDGCILYDSPSIMTVLGYDQGELLGRNAFELIHPDDLPIAFDLILETTSCPGEPTSLIFRFRHRSGSWRFMESVGNAVAGATGMAVVVNSRDVTDRISAPDIIRKSQDELEARARARGQQMEETQVEMLERLAQAAELRDDETGRHTRRVGEMAGLVAREIGLPEDQVESVRRAAPLHDVGKIGVPDAILRKRGSLTTAEMDVMRTHTVLGGRILSGGRSGLIRDAEQIALHHHERWDGGGYPHGLRGEEIPLAARIVAIADVFDALTHDRPYRPACPVDEVTMQVRESRGTHFDPELTDAFLALDPSGFTRHAEVVTHQPDTAGNMQ